MRVRMSSGVKRVTVLQPTALRNRGHIIQDVQDRDVRDRVKFVIIDNKGLISRGEIRMSLGPIKRRSGMLKPVDKRLRRLLRAQRRALDRYLVLHDRSSRRRRNGAFLDLGRNMGKVIRLNND